MAAGLKLGQTSGLWVTGSGSVANPGGITLNQLTGVWITGSGTVATAGITLNQLTGVWITGATSGRARGGSFAYDAKMHRWLLKEDEELMIIVAAAMELL